MKTDKKIAVLIDSDNVSAKYIQYIMMELSNHGVPTIKRAYGDWTRTNLDPWKKILLNYSIIPMQQYGYTSGKNATDSALIIDAMDILHMGLVDGFCIVSSDSDFTRLASRVRESGLMVIGMGEKKTPSPFINACELFKYLEVLEKTLEEEPRVTKDEDDDQAPGEVKKAPDAMVSAKSLIKSIKRIIKDNSDEDNWIGLGELGSRLQKRHPDFDSRNYGYSKLSALVKSYNVFEVELRKRKGIPHGGDVYVRIKD